MPTYQVVTLVLLAALAGFWFSTWWGKKLDQWSQEKDWWEE